MFLHALAVGSVSLSRREALDTRQNDSFPPHRPIGYTFKVVPLSIGFRPRKVSLLILISWRGEIILPVTLKTVYGRSFPIHRGGYFWSQSIRSHNRLRECCPVMLWVAVFISSSPGFNITWHHIFAHLSVTHDCHWIWDRFLPSFSTLHNQKNSIKSSCTFKVGNRRKLHVWRFLVKICFTQGDRPKFFTYKITGVKVPAQN